jgi:hypothetical protein
MAAKVDLAGKTFASFAASAIAAAISPELAHMLQS